jgi:hypothetical protein
MDKKADNTWEGLVLDFSFNPDPSNLEETTPQTADGKACSAYTNTTINKLCSDLWYLEKLEDSDFVKTCLMKPRYRITLPAADHPKNCAKPGVDVMKSLPQGGLMDDWAD